MKQHTMKHPIFKLMPVLFSFFVMGFVDVVGISTSYVKQDFQLNDKLANLLPMMVFVWFAVCSLPVGVLMGKIGRKKTVLISGIITTIAMLMPLFEYTFPTILVAFALLGIGNTILQVSLNPLMTNVTKKEKLTSMLTLGQFVKAIASALGPILIGFAAGAFGNWKLVFPIYAGVTLLSFIWLFFVPIDEKKIMAKKKGFGAIFSLLKDKYLLALFSIIVLIVGFEVGLLTAVPKYLSESFHLPLETGGLTCSLYFIARTIGTLAGAVILSKFPIRKFFITSMIIGVLSLVCFIISGNVTILMVCLFIVGLTCANVFPIAFSKAIQHRQEYADEISALMIVGVAGGALIPPVMGALADLTTQRISLLVPLLALIYILYSSIYVIKK